MKIFSWNCRGLSITKRSFNAYKIDNNKKRFIKEKGKHADIIIISETHHKTNEAKFLNIIPQYKLAGHTSYDQITGSLGRGRGGGLMVFLPSHVQSKFEILVPGHAILNWFSVDNITNFIVSIYGSPQGSDAISASIFVDIKNNLVNKLADLNIQGRLQFFLVGDFNNDPNSGRKPRCTAAIDNMCNYLQAQNVETDPTNYTYFKAGSENTCSQIDHLYSNLLNWEIEYIHTPLSDHVGILYSKYEGKYVKNQITTKDHILVKEQTLTTIQDLINDLLIRNSDEFLIQNRSYNDIQSSYSQNPEILEQELSFSSEIVFPLLNEVIIKSKKAYDQVEKQLRQDEKNVYLKYRNQLFYLRRKLKTANDNDKIELQEQLQSLKDEYRKKFQHKTDYIQNKISHFNRDNYGRMTASTFKCLKPAKFNKKIRRVQLPDGSILTKDTDILPAFVNHYRTVVDNVDRFQSKTVKELLIEKGVISENTEQEAFTSRNENNKQVLISCFTKREINDAIKDFNAFSSPGQSGMTRSFLLLIFHFIPETLTQGVWQYATNQTNIQIANWLKIRKIIFIPKPKKANKNLISNFRPISLLEVFYKLPAKIINRRIMNSIKDDFSKNQFGFIPGRTASSASLHIQTLVSYASKNNRPIQLVNVDIQSAFDSIFPSATIQMMRILGIHNFMLKTVQNLIDQGKAFIQINGKKSDIFSIQNGIGQGSPISSTIYVITHEIPLLIYKHVLDRNDNFKFKITIQNPADPNNQVKKFKAELIAFADDGNSAMDLVNHHSLSSLYEIFNSITPATGLSINPNKTEILFINTSPEIQEQVLELNLGKAVNEMRHLGIYFTSNPSLSRDLNVTRALESISTAIQQLSLINTDIYTKRLLLNNAIHSKLNHFMMFTPFKTEELQSIWKKLVTALYSRNTDNQMTKGRHLVATKRIPAPFGVGGLNLTPTDIKYRSLSSDSANRFLRDIFQNKSLNITEHILKEQFTEFLHKKGSKQLKELAIKNKEHHPFISNYLMELSNIIQDLELSSDSWETGALIGNALETSIFKFTVTDVQHLWDNNIFTVGSLFPPAEDLTRSLERTINLDSFPANTRIKINNLVSDIKVKRLQLSNRICIFTHCEEFLKRNTLIPSTFIKNKHKEDMSNQFAVAPAYTTRINDGIPVPPAKSFEAAYKINIKSDFSSYQKAMNLHILNRTLWTNKKSYQSNQLNRLNPNCEKCPMVEDTIHLLIDCEIYAEKMWALLNLLIKKIKPLSVINFYHILYFIKITGFNKKENEELQQVIQEIKTRIYSEKSSSRTIYAPQHIQAHLKSALVKIQSYRVYKLNRSLMCTQLLHILNQIIRGPNMD